MPVGSVTPAIPPQVMAALSAIANTQSAELAAAASLEQGFQAMSPSLNPGLGQNVNLSV
jgi:hypothetical protein